MKAKDKNETVRTLKLFNEKANKIEAFSFIKTAFGEKTGFKILGEDGQFLITQRFGPNEESIDAFLMTLGYFLKNNEAISFENMAKLYATLPVSTDLIQRFNEARNNINEFLDRTSPVKIGDKENTRRYVFEIFLWGGHLHANKEKKLVYDNWKAERVLFPILEHEFVFDVFKVFLTILDMKTVNEEALAQITLMPKLL